MAKAIKYNYKGLLTSMRELSDIFGVSYARMSFLMKEHNMDPDKVEAARGLGYAKKGKKAEKFLVNASEGLYLSVREIMNETGLTYAQVAGRVKKNIRGEALLRTAKEIAIDKINDKEAKAKVKAEEKAKRDRVREEKRKGREALKKFKSLKIDVTTGAPVLRNPDGSKYDTVPFVDEKKPKLSPSQFIEGLEKERDEYLLAQSLGGHGASQADVAELERVFGS